MHYTCLRAVKSAGFSGNILYRGKIEDISKLTLPCILLLDNDKSCVLTGIEKEKSKELEELYAECIFPEMENTTQKIKLSELQAEYIGYMLYISVPDRTSPTEKTCCKAWAFSKKHWFWSVLRYYAPIYRHVALASLFINIMVIASSLFVMNVYDRGIPNNAFETLWVLALGVLIIYFFDFLLRRLRTHFVDVAGRNADVVLSSMLVEKVLSIRMDKRPESTGSLVNNVREFEQVREFFGSTSLLACIDVPFVIISLLIIGFICGSLVFIPLIAMPLLIMLGLSLQAMTKKSSEQSFKQNMQKNALLVDMVNGLETIKVCQAESKCRGFGKNFPDFPHTLLPRAENTVSWL